MNSLQEAKREAEESLKILLLNWDEIIIEDDESKLSSPNHSS